MNDEFRFPSQIRIDLYVHGLTHEGTEALILKRLEALMIDTQSILKAVGEERTVLAGWKRLLSELVKTVSDLSQKLADAIAANDPVAMAQVQADLDKAATDLSGDNAEALTAINSVPPGPVPTP